MRVLSAFNASANFPPRSIATFFGGDAPSRDRNDRAAPWGHHDPQNSERRSAVFLRGRIRHRHRDRGRDAAELTQGTADEDRGLRITLTLAVENAEARRLRA